MPRILGVDIPNNKKVPYSLAALYGIGLHLAKVICEKTGIDAEKRAYQLSEEELGKLSAYIEANYVIEGNLRRERRPFQGDRLLPWFPPRAQPALPRPAHAHQLAHPQGPQEDGRQQEDPPQVRVRA